MRTVDGERIEFAQWTVRGDSLVGTEPRVDTRTAVALADVQDVEVRAYSKSKTWLAVGIPLVIVGGLVAAGIAIGNTFQ